MQALHVGVCSTIAPSQKHFKQKTIRKPIYPQNTSQSIFHDLHNCKYCGGAHSFILCTKYWPSMLALAQIHDARIYIRNQEIREHLGEHLTDQECKLAWFHQELYWENKEAENRTREKYELESCRALLDLERSWSEDAENQRRILEKKYDDLEKENVRLRNANKLLSERAATAEKSETLLKSQVNQLKDDKGKMETKINQVSSQLASEISARMSLEADIIKIRSQEEERSILVRELEGKVLLVTTERDSQQITNSYEPQMTVTKDAIALKQTAVDHETTKDRSVPVDDNVNVVVIKPEFMNIRKIFQPNGLRNVRTGIG